LIATHDIWTFEGCAAADEYLDGALALADAVLCEVREWSSGFDELAQQLANPEIQDLLSHGILAGGAVDWSMATIVDVLRAAEQELAESGWTSLDAAIRFARTQAPEQTPRLYGCVSWRQVLHDSGQFELRRSVTNEGSSTGAMFRSR
jgi:hypothetical protein